MNRRDALMALLALGSAPLPLIAQQTRLPRVGYASTGKAFPPSPLLESFRHGLQALGYVEGRNIQVEYRYADFSDEGLRLAVNDLVRLNVDVLVVPTLGSARAAQQATGSIPIVFVASEDPVAIGLVKSLSRPGGNITGLARFQRQLSGKRLELLAESIPGLSRVAVLWDSGSETATLGYREYEVAARARQFRIQSLEVNASKPDFEAAFQAAVRGRANALVTITNNTTFRQQARIAGLAVRHRLPSMFEGSSWVQAGGLMSYSTNDEEVFRRAAAYVDKILRGAKPAELPIEQPTVFELVINLKTAKAIGTSILQAFVARADRVIE